MPKILLIFISEYREEQTKKFALVRVDNPQWLCSNDLPFGELVSIHHQSCQSN